MTCTRAVQRAGARPGWEITTLLFALIGRPAGALAAGDPPPDLDVVLEAEQARTTEYRARGLLREMWLFADQAGALLLCEADSLHGAREISAGYPMVRAGYVAHEIHELSPGLAPGPRPGEAG